VWVSRIIGTKETDAMTSRKMLTNKRGVASAVTCAFNFLALITHQITRWFRGVLNITNGSDQLAG
jgi:hypothetical protein